MRRSASGLPHDRRLLSGSKRIESHCVPVRCGPFTPGCLLPNATLDAACVDHKKPSVLEASHVEACTDGSLPSCCLGDEEDAIAEAGPLAFLFDEHDEVDQSLDSMIRQLVQRPRRDRIVSQPSDRTKGPTRRLEPDWLPDHLVHFPCNSRRALPPARHATTCTLLAAAHARLGPPGRLLRLPQAVSSRLAARRWFAAGVSRRFVVARIGARAFFLYHSFETYRCGLLVVFHRRTATWIERFLFGCTERIVALWLVLLLWWPSRTRINVFVLTCSSVSSWRFCVGR